MWTASAFLAPDGAVEGMTVSPERMLRNPKKFWTEASQRSAVPRRWVAQRGWIYHPAPWQAAATRFHLGPGKHRFGKTVLWGFEGTYNSVPILGFGFYGQEHNGINQGGQLSVMLAVELEGARMPGLFARRQLRNDAKDFQFENRQFNQDWYVSSDSQRFAYDLFTPRAMQLFLSAPPQIVSLWTDQDFIFLQVVPTDANIDQDIEFLTRFVSFVPAFVITQAGGTPVRVTSEGPGAPTPRQIAGW